MNNIGSLEEIVLMILMKYERCSGVEIAKYHDEALNKAISLPAIHVVLKRMEKKGWVSSEFGSPTAARGGRRKRIYWASSSGRAVVTQVHETKARLWDSIKPSFEYVRI
ncbi:MAG: PadR family transcriptional regulator [Reichenbachiella sp.]|uniref:PadR family transcriptional regulator n=1 Tax=Reichenbachiella sp. TaxID=2184521 RepID=UPI0032667B32